MPFGSVSSIYVSMAVEKRGKILTLILESTGAKKLSVFSVYYFKNQELKGNNFFQNLLTVRF